MDLARLKETGALAGPFRRRNAASRIAQRLCRARTTWRLWRRSPASLGAAVRAVARDLFNV